MRAVIKFHEKSKLENNGVCLFGKYHDILYVATKLCFVRNLRNTKTTTELLTGIYECENTFEKFFECAIFGTKVIQLISGWRSYYKTQDENVKACLYFLEQATDGKLTFDCKNKRCNFVDVPMNSYENLSPLKTAVKAENWDLVILLMRYGATTYLPRFDEDFDKYSLFPLFIQKLEKYSLYNFCDAYISKSFKTFMRSVPSLSSVAAFEDDQEDAQTALTLSLFLKELNAEDVEEPRTLKHLARCAARNYLATSHQLPADARKLNIPKILEQYLNLEFD